MIIYTGMTASKKQLEEHYIPRKMGMMISTNPNTYNLLRPWWAEYNGIVPMALDNGAFSAWRNNKPFPEYAFLKTIDILAQYEVELEFIVAPDIVSEGARSLECHRNRADSVDNTSIKRDGYWHRVDEFQNPKQLNLFDGRHQ